MDGLLLLLDSWHAEVDSAVELCAAAATGAIGLNPFAHACCDSVLALLNRYFHTVPDNAPTLIAYACAYSGQAERRSLKRLMKILYVAVPLAVARVFHPDADDAFAHMTALCEEVGSVRGVVARLARACVFADVQSHCALVLPYLDELARIISLHYTDENREAIPGVPVGFLREESGPGVGARSTMRFQAQCGPAGTVY